MNPSKHIELDIDIGADARDWSAIQAQEKLKPVETELRRIEELVAEVVLEMDYLRTREQKLRDTNESTNERVKWFAYGTMGMLVGLGAWQVIYLRAYFRLSAYHATVNFLVGDPPQRFNLARRLLSSRFTSEHTETVILDWVQLDVFLCLQMWFQDRTILLTEICPAGLSIRLKELACYMGEAELENLCMDKIRRSCFIHSKDTAIKTRDIERVYEHGNCRRLRALFYLELVLEARHKGASTPVSDNTAELLVECDQFNSDFSKIMAFCAQKKVRRWKPGRTFQPAFNCLFHEHKDIARCTEIAPNNIAPRNQLVVAVIRGALDCIKE
ncbi:MAG: hypothetical protein Q9169_007866 [Polycauliona sp. 2 TL-2023]